MRFSQIPLTALLLLGTLLPVFAEATYVRGVIKGPQGPLPGVIMSFRERGSGRMLTARTDAQGRYAFENPPHGDYELLAGRPGHSDVTISKLQVDGATRINLGNTLEGAAAAGPPVPVSADTMAAKLLVQVRPVAPPEVRDIPGPVRVAVTITADGTVRDAQVIGGPAELAVRTRALQAVRQWRWQPTRRNGQPVEVTTEVDVPFAGTPD